MIDVDQALALVLECVAPGLSEVVPLSRAMNRIVAAAVATDIADPPFDRSVMDGYAVRAQDVAQAPVSLRIAGEVTAGSLWPHELRPNEAVRINTGAPIPQGADAVVRVEETEADSRGSMVRINKSVERGNFITRQAAHRAAGDVVLEVGTRLTPGAMGAAAAAGASSLCVYRRPRVAIISTGDELVATQVVPRPGQIRNSNQIMLAALIESAGGEVHDCGVGRDDLDDLQARIMRTLASDVLCLTGGVSMGTADLVPEALTACDVKLRFQKMAIKPGRPVIFGTAPTGALVFALPGNPVSVFVGFELLVRPALARRQGCEAHARRWVRAVCSVPLPPTSNRRTYIPAIARADDAGRWEVAPTKWHGSGDVFGLAQANALIMRPPNAEAVDCGCEVLAMLLE